MMKDPVAYAKSLMEKQGPQQALHIANKSVQEMQVALGLGGSPFAEEVDMQEHTHTDKETGSQKTRTVTVVDEGAVSKRMSKCLVFWKNAQAYIKNRQPKKSEASAA